MEALMVGVAAVAGILVGFWLRSTDARAERITLEHQNHEIGEALARARAELSQNASDSTGRAASEALAAEREKTIAQMVAERDMLRADLQARVESEKAQATRMGELEADLRNERQNLAERVALLESAKQALGDHFETLAAEVLEKKSKLLTEDSQKELGALLSPLREQIQEFREKVEEAQEASLVGRTELTMQLKGLESLNRTLSDEAHNLASALRRDTKKHGNWGETVLLNILESSGLQKGLHYTLQQSFVEDGTNGTAAKFRQTDVLVKLPEGRHVIIDSKVSMSAYTDSIRAGNDQDRAESVKQHLAAIREHYNELASRSYHELPGIQSPDFVVMFVPIEPAFMLALQEDESIWLDAYQKGVLLSGPTTVLFVIRIVENLWRQEQQVRNVEAVMKRGADLYDRIVEFAAGLESVGSAIHGARQAFDEASRQLSGGPGSLMRQAEMLVELDARPRKRSSKSVADASGMERPQLTLVRESSPEQPAFDVAAEAEQMAALEEPSLEMVAEAHPVAALEEPSLELLAREAVPDAEVDVTTELDKAEYAEELQADEEQEESLLSFHAVEDEHEALEEEREALPAS